jgi:(2Fe-2S) ferredoxin
MVVVYPENVWYSHVNAKDAEVIFAQHILGGRPVEHLRFRPQGPGAHKLTRHTDGRPIERCTLCRNGHAETAAYAGE